eukprot:777206_1
MTMHILIAAFGLINTIQCTTLCGRLCARLCGRRDLIQCNYTQTATDFDQFEFDCCLNDSRSLMSEMLSDMESNGHVFDDLPNTPINDTDGIVWFDVNHKFLAQDNDRVATNTITVLVQSIVYGITQTIYFLGHYSNLQHLSQAMLFQEVFDYFAQFQNGFYRVNLTQFVTRMPTMRHKLMHLPNETNEDFDVLSQLLGLHNPLSSSSRMTRSSRNPKKRNFWNTNWMCWNRQPLKFSGLHPQDKDKQIRLMLLQLVLEMDKLTALLTGNDNYPSGIDGVRCLLKWKKSIQVFVQNFFGSCVSVKIDFIVPRMIYDWARHASDKERKLIMGLRQVFIIDVLKFFIKTVQVQRQLILLKKDDRKQISARITPRLVTDEAGSHVLRFELKCDSLFFQRFGHSVWVEQLQIVNNYMVFLLENEDELKSMTFNAIQKKGGVLFLLNTVLQFSVHGGRCGYAFHTQSKEFQQWIVCEVPLPGVDDEDTINLWNRSTFGRKCEGDPQDCADNLYHLTFDDLESESTHVNFRNDTPIEPVDWNRDDDMTRQDARKFIWME